MGISRLPALAVVMLATAACADGDLTAAGGGGSGGADGALGSGGSGGGAGCHLMLDGRRSAEPCAVRRSALVVEDRSPYLAAADLDADGATELVLHGMSSTFVDALRVARQFERTPLAVPEGWSPVVGAGPTVADVDGDGVHDLLVRKYGELHIPWVMRGDGAGSFAEPLLINPPAAESIPFANFDWFDVGDVNGDGRPDLFGFFERWNFTVAFGQEGGGFAPPAVSHAALDPESFRQPEAPNFRSADLNHDGRIDAVLGVHGGLVTLLGTEDGFESQPALVLGDTVHQHRVSALADFDGDGELDAMVWPGTELGDPTRELWFFRGDGAGNFAPWQEAALPGVIAGVHVADFDDDGRADVFFASNGGRLEALAWNGQRWETIFAAEGERGVISYYTFQLAVADFDGDGAKDVAWITTVSAETTALEVVLVPPPSERAEPRP